MRFSAGDIITTHDVEVNEVYRHRLTTVVSVKGDEYIVRPPSGLREITLGESSLRRFHRVSGICERIRACIAKYKERSA
jgi:hypothetical protein